MTYLQNTYYTQDNQQSDSDIINDSSNDDIKDEDIEYMDTLETQKQNNINILQEKGYIYHKKIAKTLQGEIFEAIDKNNDNEIVVIKKAQKDLVEQSVTIRDGKKIKIKEDIWREIKIQQYLNSFEDGESDNKLPLEHIKLLEIFEDEDNIYVVTEHGGVDFFQWICTAHKAIENNKISMKYWWKNIRFIFKQMVNYTIWLHETMNICHLDISLENMLLKNGEYFYETNKFTYSQQIKFCDFGLAEYFDINSNPSFNCNKHVGKESYMAPEVFTKRQSFDATKADSWSLGVILFIMMTGAPAYQQPDIINDKSFQYIIYKQIPSLLANWGRTHYINPLILDLLQKIFVLDPSKRYSLKQIRDHPFLR